MCEVLTVLGAVPRMDSARINICDLLIRSHGGLCQRARLRVFATIDGLGVRQMLQFVNTCPLIAKQHRHIYQARVIGV